MYLGSKCIGSPDNFGISKLETAEKKIELAQEYANNNKKFTILTQSN